MKNIAKRKCPIKSSYIGVILHNGKVLLEQTGDTFSRLQAWVLTRLNDEFNESVIGEIIDPKNNKVLACYRKAPVN